MKKTKKEIMELLEAGKLKNLCKYIIADGTKADIINDKIEELKTKLL